MSPNGKKPLFFSTARQLQMKEYDMRERERDYTFIKKEICYVVIQLVGDCVLSVCVYIYIHCLRLVGS